MGAVESGAPDAHKRVVCQFFVSGEDAVKVEICATAGADAQRDGVRVGQDGVAVATVGSALVLQTPTAPAFGVHQDGEALFVGCAIDFGDAAHDGPGSVVVDGGEGAFGKILTHEAHGAHAAFAVGVDVERLVPFALGVVDCDVSIVGQGVSLGGDRVVLCFDSSVHAAFSMLGVFPVDELEYT